MNSKIIGHYSLGLSLPFLKKLIVENQIFLQIFTSDETVINNAEDCNSFMFYPKFTTLFIQMLRWFNQERMSYQICNASTGISILFILAFLICLGLFFFEWKEEGSIGKTINLMIAVIISPVLIKIFEILIFWV